MSSPYEAFAAALLKARGPHGDTPDAGRALDMVAAAFKDDRFTSAAMLREALMPALMLAQRPPVEAGRQRHIDSWLTTIATAWAAHPGEALPAGASAPADHWPPAPIPAADAEAAVALLKEAVLCGGNVIELPSGVRVRREKP